MPTSTVNESLSWNDIDARKFFMFNATFSFCNRLAFYPANMVKTRLQVQHKTALYSGTWDALRKIARSEGIRGLYRGFGPSLFGIAVGQTYVVTYEYLRGHIREQAKERGISSLAVDTIAGAAAAVVAQTIGVPLDVVVQRIMVQGTSLVAPENPQTVKGNQFTGALAMGRALWQKEGFRGLYRGYVLTLAQLVPGSAIWWSSYQYFRAELDTSVPVDCGVPSVVRNTGVIASAAFAAHTLMTVVSNPIDVIRTRVMVNAGGVRTSAWNTARNLVIAEGWSSIFTKGLAARVLSTGPAAAITMLYYEVAKHLARRSPDD